nr:DNA-directed RNA polymerase subunit alpha C-terminal domain-containing protein [Bacilli bacterium]
MNRSIKLLQLDEDIITKLKDHNICQVNHLINFHYEKEGFSQVETKMIVDAFDLYKQEELTKELRGRVNYFPLEYLDEKYSFGELGLSLRAFNGLTRNQITTVSQILKTIIHFEIYELDHLGAKSIAQIMTIVKDIVAREDLAKYLPIYASLHRFDDFTLTEIGFFEQMVKKLSALGFDTLGKLRFGYLNGTLGTLFNYKTMQSFTRKLAEYFSFTADDDFQFFQLYLVDNCFGKMSWTDILSIIGTKDPLYLEQLKKRLQGCCELLVNEEGVRLPYFREKIKNSSLKEETKAILEARFQGMTLQKIASLFHKTRERIRQIIRDRMAQIPLYLEKALVKEYNRFVWHPEVFKRVYAIDDFSFNVVKYLGERISFKEKYEYPQAYIQSLMDQGRIQAFSLAGFQEYFPKQFAPKMLIYGKTYDVMTKKQFLEFVIEHFIPKKGLHKSQIVHRANQVAAENHLDFAYDKFIDDVSNTILGLRYTRYYDYSL